MKSKYVLLISIGAFADILVLFWLSGNSGAKRELIIFFSSDRWSEYQALTKMLSIGMQPAEVERILGHPSDQDRFSIGERWIYTDDGPMADWTYIVEFKRRQELNTNDLELCYVLNMKDRIIPDAPRSEWGQMLDLKESGGTILFGDPTYNVHIGAKTNGTTNILK